MLKTKNKTTLSARPEQALKISLSSDEEIRYWTKTLHCGFPELSMAIFSVGTSFADVQFYLERQAAFKWRKLPTFNF